MMVLIERRRAMGRAIQALQDVLDRLAELAADIPEVVTETINEIIVFLGG